MKRRTEAPWFAPLVIVLLVALAVFVAISVLYSTGLRFQ
jgi:hypothetical protein